MVFWLLEILEMVFMRLWQELKQCDIGYSFGHLLVIIGSLFIIVLQIDSIKLKTKCMSSSTNSSSITQKTVDFRIKYKTERCRYWYERGFCPFNQMCAFAHSEHELRDKHQLNTHYKTKICINFKNHGYCKYGDRCQFLHVQEAPLVYSREIVDSNPVLDQRLRKFSNASEQPIENKHQKELSILQDYGLDLLSMQKLRKKRWRSFLMEGVDYYAIKGQNLMIFEQQFPDYNFLRKPRLGSM